MNVDEFLLHCDGWTARRAAHVLIAGFLLAGCSGRDERVTWYPNGRVKERWHERTVGPNRVIRDGKFEAFYPDGARQSVGEYINGDSLGLWQEWYMSGGNKFEKTFGELGKLKGRTIVWMPSGDTLEFKTYNDRGELEGRYTLFWRDNGEVHEQGEYKDGKRHGIWTRWYHNGQMEYGHEYDRGRSVGRWIDFGIDGHIASNREFLRDLPAELADVWPEALVEGVPVKRSSVYQRSDRRVDTVAADERDYGELQKRGVDWIVPFKWHSPRFGAIEKQRMDTLYVWRPREKLLEKSVYAVRSLLLTAQRAFGWCQDQSPDTNTSVSGRRGKLHHLHLQIIIFSTQWRIQCLKRIISPPHSLFCLSQA